MVYVAVRAVARPIYRARRGWREKPRSGSNIVISLYYVKALERLKMGKSARPAFFSFPGSSSLSMNRTFFERNIHLVADYGQGLADGACGKL